MTIKILQEIINRATEWTDCAQKGESTQKSPASKPGVTGPNIKPSVIAALLLMMVWIGLRRSALARDLPPGIVSIDFSMILSSFPRSDHAPRQVGQ
jgi:hypothetical protein